MKSTLWGVPAERARQILKATKSAWEGLHDLSLLPFSARNMRLSCIYIMHLVTSGADYFSRDGKKEREREGNTEIKL
jgi:hypothetical protein